MIGAPRTGEVKPVPARQVTDSIVAFPGELAKAAKTGDMVRRDRNHPSVTIWGLLNETYDGPVFRHAVEYLPALRALDP
ncbi:MAG: glycoside hydrolase family 2 TIM barrel-domain containing protein, partial [bacterium]